MLWHIIFLVVTAVSCFGCRTTAHRMEQLVMGSIPARITVIFRGSSSDKAQSAMVKAFEKIHKVDRLMSKYKDDSDVSRVNASQAAVSVRVDPMTLAVFEESRRLAELTGGAFDITALPLSTVWGFWPEREPLVPAEEEIQKALSHVGYGKLALDRNSQTVMKTDAGTRVDLGGIAKGYAVDVAIEALREEGIRDALVEIGGETRSIGKNKEGKPWRIGVLHPRGRGFLTILHLSNRAVATSGDYMKFFVVDGKKYCHLIDPRSGRPISNDLCSVTVIADNCTEADALATAISVIGMKEGLALIESLPGKEAILARRGDEANEIKISVSSGLKELRIMPQDKNVANP